MLFIFNNIYKTPLPSIDFNFLEVPIEPKKLIINRFSRSQLLITLHISQQIKPLLQFLKTFQLKF